MGVNVWSGRVPRTYAMVAAGIGIESPESGICALLEKLPREVRDKIWRYILVKPMAIIPKVYIDEYDWYTGKPEKKHHHVRYKRKYSHIFAQLCDKQNDHLRSTNSLCTKVSWTTKPTREQLKLIKDGASTLQIDNYPEPGQQAICQVHHRDGFGPQIINRAEIKLQQFGIPLNIMRVCKQIQEECGTILYGENTYQFNTECIYTYNDLKEMTWRIPSFSTNKGVIPDRAAVTEAIEKLFDLDGYNPILISKDPFIRFIAKIGRRNASCLKDVKIDGMFRTKMLSSINIDDYLGFGTILPIYTLIMREICPQLRKITLHQSASYSGWSEDIKKTHGMTDEDIVDSIIAKVVLGLPYLQELQLGAYSKVPTISHEWGKALQWMKFVDERKRDYRPKAEMSDDTSIKSVNARYIGVRTSSGLGGKNCRKPNRSGSYGTSNCTWTLTWCSSERSITNYRSLKIGGNERINKYGYLPLGPKSDWICRDAHGGTRDRDGSILNIADKVDKRTQDGYSWQGWK